MYKQNHVYIQTHLFVRVSFLTVNLFLMNSWLVRALRYFLLWLSHHLLYAQIHKPIFAGKFLYYFVSWIITESFPEDLKLLMCSNPLKVASIILVCRGLRNLWMWICIRAVHAELNWNFWGKGEMHICCLILQWWSWSGWK